MVDHIMEIGSSNRIICKVPSKRVETAGLIFL